MGVNELRELKQLKDENARLKQIVADLSLDKQMLQDVLKNSLKIRQLRELATKLIKVVIFHTETLPAFVRERFGQKISE